jgi:biopolymer transport protein ExbD
MGGVDVGEGGKGKRKTLDSEINMIPMIDLLMVTISFLLITAVWTHMARINADAQVPGPPRPDVEQEKVEPEKQLHIEMRSPEKFVLIWKQGGTTLTTIDVPRTPNIQEVGASKIVRFPVTGQGKACDKKNPERQISDLGDVFECEWTRNGQHSAPTDKKIDQAILHTDNKVEYMYIVAVIDAVYKAKRPLQVGSKTEDVPAFNVTFAVN